MGLACHLLLTVFCMTEYQEVGVSIPIPFLSRGLASAAFGILRPIKFLHLQIFVLMVFLSTGWPELPKVLMH